MKRVLQQYMYNLGVLASIAMNVIVLLGSPHESTSMRVAREVYRECNPAWRWQLSAYAINSLFRVINNEENHPLDALDGEDHAREIII